MPIVMTYEGVPGESKVDKHEKWIELNSFEFGIGRRLGSARATSTREDTDASVSEIVVRKKTDGSTVKFFEESLVGKLNKVVEIAFVRTTAGQYINWKLEGCGVAGLSFKSAGGQDARPDETLHLNFTKVTLKYTPIGDDLTGSPEAKGYNLATGLMM
jgi:type VI secretion system secreted protein Hcp